MRIAVVTTSWPSSEEDASGHFVRAEARKLEREGHEIVIVAPKSGGAFGWPGVAARVKARPWRAIEAGKWLVSARKRLIAEGPFDRIVAHWAVPSAWPIGEVGAPLFVVSHGGDVRALLAMPGVVRTRIVRRIAEKATEWRFVSAALRDSLIAGLDAGTAERVQRIARVEACAIEVPDVRASANTLRANHSGERVAVCVGRLVASKRVDRVIDHVAECERAALLVVVGDGPERARLERHATERGVRARFLGQTDRREALAWIAAADVLVHASRAEGLSTVIREAEALGTEVRVLG